MSCLDHITALRVYNLVGILLLLHLLPQTTWVAIPGFPTTVSQMPQYKRLMRHVSHRWMSEGEEQVCPSNHALIISQPWKIRIWLGYYSSFICCLKQYGWEYQAFRKAVSQMPQQKKAHETYFTIFECKKVRSRSAHHVMPWSYHSPDSVELSWPIIPASSVLSNNMGWNTRLYGRSPCSIYV